MRKTTMQFRAAPGAPGPTSLSFHTGTHPGAAPLLMVQPGPEGFCVMDTEGARQAAAAFAAWADQYGKG